MGLRLPDKWVWDSWYAFDGKRYHAFYLHASRALGDPDRRHRNPIVGHAISEDLNNWTIVQDALAVSDSPAFDSWTCWTGSVVRADDGKWWMFYTGTSREDGGDIQTIGAATSDDLMTWTKISAKPLVQADGRWYEKLEKAIWHDEAWRDPWVFRFENDPKTWHMLITARANHGEAETRGVMGHATSTNLLDWQVQPPLSKPGQGFGQLEVFQFEIVDGVPIVVFCCGWRELSEARLAEFGQNDATYSVVVSADLTSVDFNKANAFSNPMVYAARIIRGADGWYLIGFRNIEENGFVGELCDAVPVTASHELGLIPR
jgi:beta-fructofuranosidase